MIWAEAEGCRVPIPRGAATSTSRADSASPLWATGILIGLYGVGTGLYFPRFFAALAARTPGQLRPVVMTAVTVAISAPGPIGFVAAGLLNQYAAGRAAGLILVAAAAVAGAVIVAAAIRRDDVRPLG